MRIVADMHTHTISSGHAYSTVNELAAEAARKGLLALAITDHGPALPGAPHIYHFGAMRFIPETICGVRILRGIEANIIDRRGTLDLPEHYLRRLDFVMAGLHEGCGFDGEDSATYTEAVVNAMENPLVKAVSHPGNPLFPLDSEAVVTAARRTGTALEINNTSFSISRKGSRPNCERLAELIARLGAPLVIGSDAHIAQMVGVFDDAVAAVTAAGIPATQVVNASLERLLRFLGLEE
ncbi:MAG: phosphatase [Geobacteraceae bacterium]|nr:phosphatase [Geobacteraceae bacterium]